MKRIIFILSFFISTYLQAQVNNIQRPFAGFNRAVKINNIFYVDSADVSGFFISRPLDENPVDNLNVFKMIGDVVAVRVVNSSVSTITTESSTYIFEDSINDPPVSFPAGTDTTYWMVGGAPTGIFEGHDFDVARYVDGVIDVFIDPTVNDWGLTLDDNFWHQYNGSTWPRRNPPDWKTIGNFGGGVLGSTNNSNVFLRYNNNNRIVLQGAGTRFPQLTGARAGLMGLNVNGLARNLQIDTLTISQDSLANGVLSAIGSGDTFIQADTIVYLSKSAGIVSDADISAGSTTFGTDNTSAIQTILDLASSSQHLKVVWDVAVSITGLRIKSYTWIEALPGYGAILRTNSNKAMFKNYDTAFGREPADSSIKIEGGIWNGNSYNSIANPAQAQGTSADGPTVVFAFYGVRNLIVRDCQIYRQRVYAFHGINIRNGLVENVVIDCGSDGFLNSDGVHFDGYSENCVGRNLKIRSLDDAIANNADDLYLSQLGGWATIFGYFPATAAGPINNIRWENIYLDSSQFGYRALSGASRIDNIIVKNLSGYATGYSAIIDNYYHFPDSVTNDGPGNVGTITIDNDQVNVYTDVFGVHNSLINVGCNIDNLILKDIKRNNFFANVVPSLYVSGVTTTIKNLVVDGYDSYDTTNFVTPHIYNEGIITSASISRANAKVKDTSNGSVLLDNAGSIKYLTFNGIIADSLNSIYNNHGTTTSTINAVNIIHKAVNYSFTTNKADTLTLSNYIGTNTETGTFAVKLGDAFAPPLWQLGSGNTLKPINSAYSISVGNAGATAGANLYAEGTTLPLFGIKSTSGGSFADGQWINSAGATTNLMKAGPSYSYKIIGNNNFAIYESTYDISLIADAGNVKFSGGGSATPNLMVNNSGNVLVGTSTNSASAILKVESTTQGFLPPRMTATQASAISSPAEGLMVYVTDTNGTFTAKGWWGYDGSAWQKLNN